MVKTVAELRQIIKEYPAKIRAIADHDFTYKPLANKWSRQETLGHLIDSAHTNLRRFVLSQYDHIPRIVYDQDFWVKANAYQDSKKEDLIHLWCLMNERICIVLATMPKENYSRVCDTGKEQPALHEIKWLAEDYVLHMKHHLNQIIPGAFDIQYS